MRRRGAGGEENGIDEETADVRSFRVQVRQAGTYILDGMRMLRAAVGCLMLLLLLILLCCVLSGIFLGFDLKSDLTTSVSLVFEEPQIDGSEIVNDGGEGAPKQTCSDGNVCTVDYERDQGGCVSIPLPEGTPCETAYTTGGEAFCKLVEVQKGIKKPMCIGSCAGECNVSIDCPDIIPAQPCEPECDFWGSTPIREICYDSISLDVKCLSNVCFYSAPAPRAYTGNPAEPQFVPGDIPSFGCQNNEWFKNYCMNLISDNDTLKKHIVPVVECVEELGVLVTFGDNDETNDYLAVPPQCHYYFWCAERPMISTSVLQF